MTDSGPSCREKRRVLGLSYPKSCCEKCGPVVRAGWRCPEEAEPVAAAAGGVDSTVLLKDAARLLRCAPEGVPRAAGLLQARVDELSRQVLALRHPGPVTLEQAASCGVSRVRQARWANPFDHFEITGIHEGRPGPWVRLWSPVNAMFGAEQPDGVRISTLGIGAPHVDPARPCFEPYTGPLPDSEEYRAEAARFADARRR